MSFQSGNAETQLVILFSELSIDLGQLSYTPVGRSFFHPIDFIVE